MNAQKLKNAILQEAIEGRLVPQDPNDEPASVLLDHIRKEKAQLLKEGKLKKKDIGKTPIAEDEKPFEIPESWKWVRLGNVTEIARGGSPRPIKEYLTEDSNGLNWIKIGDTDKGEKYINSCKEKIKLEGLKKTRMVHPGDFLLTNSMSFGRPYITNIEGCIHDGWLVISPLAGVFEQSYLYYALSSTFARKQFGSKVAGAVVQNLNSDKVADSILPLPPFAEQQRIVAKIEELLPKVEEYGKAQEALGNLNAGLPERLKKSVLQEAIEGRLVPQDPNDEPASALLDRIRKEKSQLVKEGKLKKKDLEETPITEEEKPFEIPEGWEWCHLGEIVDMQMGKTPPRGEPLHWQNGKESWVSISDMKDYGHIQTTKEKISEYSVKKVFKKKSPKGTLLMSFKLTIGRTSILDIPAFHNEAIISIYPYADTNNSFRNYLFYLLPLLSILGDSKDAIKGKTLNSTSLNNLLIPLPPLAEQHRIVAKIEELLGAINALP